MLAVKTHDTPIPNTALEMIIEDRSELNMNAKEEAITMSQLTMSDFFAPQVSIM